MDKHYYTVEDLEHELRTFEARFGVPSEVFVKLRAEDAVPDAVPAHDGFVWSDLYYEVCRLRSATDQTALQPAG